MNDFNHIYFTIQRLYLIHFIDNVAIVEIICGVH